MKKLSVTRLCLVFGERLVVQFKVTKPVKYSSSSKGCMSIGSASLNIKAGYLLLSEVDTQHKRMTM